MTRTDEALAHIALIRKTAYRGLVGEDMALALRTICTAAEAAESALKDIA